MKENEDIHSIVLDISNEEIPEERLDRLKEVSKNDVDVFVISYDIKDENGNVVSLSKEEIDKLNINGMIMDEKTEITDANGNKYVIDATYYTFDENGNLIKSKKEAFSKKFKKHNTVLDAGRESLFDIASGELISSNFDFVHDSMNDLIGKLNIGERLKYIKEGNEAGLIGSIYDVNDYYKGINSELFSKLFGDANAIATIADAYNGIDVKGADVASGLSSGGWYSDDSGYSGGGSYSPSQHPGGTTIDTAELSAQTKSVIDSIKSEATSGKYDKLTTFLGTNLEAGKIGTVSIGSLDSAVKSVIPSLSEDAASAKSALSDLNAFVGQIGASEQLSGPSWDKVKADLATYQSLLGVSIEASEFLSSVIQTAQQMISDFLSPDTSLDDSVLPELESKLTEVNTQIQQLTQQVANMKASQHEVCDYDENNEPYNCHEEPSDADIAAVEATLADYESQREELETEIQRIHDFAALVNKAQAMINDAVSQVKNAFENPVKGTDGNETFSSNFNLDLSKYGIDPESSGRYLAAYNEAKAGRKEAEKPIEITEDRSKTINPLLSDVPGDTKVGKYTADEIRAMSDQEIKNLSRDEFIELVGSAAQIVYKERGGVLPSITIAQALYETGDGESFPDGSSNLYGLIGYPSDHKQGTGGLRYFDDILESTLYHATYFEHYENKCYQRFMQACRDNDPLKAADYISAYDLGHDSYITAVKDKINRYDLTRFDPAQ